ncbi:hypothetical protein [Dyadobacter sp.]|uniref:hypothetical protein n=1 Tax=Dyadobacter sp. TaxID=1914288 RepID=UPI0025BECA3B|nr:hypothetical protein [Dyadobacter sp.]
MNVWTPKTRHYTSINHIMNTLLKSVESDEAICLSYGKNVKELLSQSTASEWIEDLWIIYSDHMAFQKEAGCNPRIGEIFLSFRELVFFFQKLDPGREVKIGG